MSIRCWVRQQRGDEPASVQPELDKALALAGAGNNKQTLALVLRLKAAHLAYHCLQPAAAEPLFRECVRLFEQACDAAQAWLRQIELAGC